MPKKRERLPVVLVDDEEEILFGASYLLNSHGIQSVTALSDERRLLPFTIGRGGCHCAGSFMPHIPGTEILLQIVQNYPHVPVVVMTASQEVETAVSLHEGRCF